MSKKKVHDHFDNSSVKTPLKSIWELYKVIQSNLIIHLIDDNTYNEIQSVPLNNVTTIFSSSSCKRHGIAPCMCP